MSTCRVCGNSQFDKSHHRAFHKMIKYSTRHYAHADCAMEKWGASFFDRLTPWQCDNQFPYFCAKKYGFKNELEARAELNRNQIKVSA